MPMLPLCCLAAFAARPCCMLPPGQGGHAGSSTPDRIPAGWSLDEMAGASFAAGPPPEEKRVLTWRITEDARPLHVESCIVWFRFSDAGRPRWRLTHFYRHPRRAPAPGRWNISVVFDLPQVGQRDFDHPPTGKDLDDFLSDTWWLFGAEEGWKLVDASICADAWLAAIGERPRHAYPTIRQTTER